MKTSENTRVARTTRCPGRSGSAGRQEAVRAFARKLLTASCGLAAARPPGQQVETSAKVLGFYLWHSRGMQQSWSIFKNSIAGLKCLLGSRRGPRGGVFPADVALSYLRGPCEPAARRAAAT